MSENLEQMSAAMVNRSEIEDFLYLEANLLDDWLLDDWFGLFVEGATYEVPTASSPDDANSATTLFYIADDYERLRHRVERLKKPGAHSEWPRSRGLRMISNVRVLGVSGADISVRSAFATYRSKSDTTDCFFGHHLHVLRETEAGLKIASKKSMLDMSSLRPHGRVSLIV